MPAHARPIGYLFQDVRLFPHLSVYGNLAYADRRGRVREGRYTIEEVIDALDLQSLTTRSVRDLSGGESQRVALARTLLTRPDLLLLDEPLAALDRRRKGEILPYLESLPGRFNVPMIVVSHDIDEVARLADRIMVLAGGRVRSMGAAADIIGSLDDDVLADRADISSLLEARVERHDQRLHLTYVSVAGESLALPLSEQFEIGHQVRLRVRVRDVALATERPEKISIRNILKGEVAEIHAPGQSATAIVSVRLSSAHLRANLTRAAIEDLGLAPGAPVFVLIKSVSFDEWA